MKSTVFALLLAVVGAIAFPEPAQISRNAVEDQIHNVINRIIQGIEDLGLDPVEITYFSYKNEIIPGIADIAVLVEDLYFSGLSNIVVSELEYLPFFNRLTFAVSLPKLNLSIGQSDARISLLNNAYDGQVGGSLSISGISLSGEINLNVGIISGISVRSITLDFELGGAEADVDVRFLGTDFTNQANDLLRNRIPDFLNDNKNEINRGLEFVVGAAINAIGQRPRP